MKSIWVSIIAVTMLFTIGSVQQVHAAPQDAPAAADEMEAAQDAEAADDDEKKKGLTNRLFVEVGYGTNNMDALDMSIRTSPSQSSFSSITFDDMDYSRASIGWRFPTGKGRIRLVFQGHNETGYHYLGIGRQSSLDPALSVNNSITENLDWWTVDVVNGALTANRTPPQWSLADDANMDGAVTRDEVYYIGSDVDITANIESDLQNRIQTLDVVYGRDFGPRRYSGRWWAGMRYWGYEGTLLQSAWLRGPQTGEGFTDGRLLRLLHSSQKADGLGPTGSLGMNINYFEQRLQLFFNTQFSFTISTIEVDTGNFHTLTNLDNTQLLIVPARLQARRSRTSWQTHADAGVRLNLRQGLSFEIAYFIDGYLDAVLTPLEIRVPQSAQEVAQGTSAIFKTQDIVVDGWRSSVSFQF